MNWNEIRKAKPNQWIIVEAIKAYTDPHGKRIIDDMIIIDTCEDGSSAFKKYRELHDLNKNKEYYFLHTNKEKLDIKEEKWIGIRIQSAITA